MKIHAVILLIFSLIASNLSLFSQSQNPHISTLESLINERLDGYPLREDNKFRLASYCELKGQFEHKSDALIIDFGTYGRITFYENNFILRSTEGGVFHMDRGRNSSSQVLAMNESLQHIFDQIMLLSNHEKDPDLVAFIDEHLSLKNIEPFYKIFVRHILIKYGRYNSDLDVVEFKTEWLPDQFYDYKEPGDRQLVRKTISPLRLKLDKKILRGYYVKAGGTVYIENVKRKVKYASGEEYSPNITAFKVFAQRLFVQTTQYITTAEKRRIHAIKLSPPPLLYASASSRPMPVGYGMARNKAQTMAYSFSGKNNARRRKSENGQNSVYYANVQPLYQAQNWIPMMLGIMRAKKIDISDREVLKYFKSQPYFPDLYKQLTKEEQRAVDQHQ